MQHQPSSRLLFVQPAAAVPQQAYWSITATHSFLDRPYRTRGIALTSSHHGSAYRNAIANIMAERRVSGSVVLPAASSRGS